MSFLGLLADAASLQWPGSTDTAQATSDSLDAQTAALDQKYLNAGYESQAQYSAAVGDIATGNQSTGANDIAGSILSAFGSGAQSGPGDWLSKILAWIGGLLSGLLKAIPWWVWLAVAGFLFWYFDGWALVKKLIKKYEK